MRSLKSAEGLRQATSVFILKRVRRVLKAKKVGDMSLIRIGTV